MENLRINFSQFGRESVSIVMHINQRTGLRFEVLTALSMKMAVFWIVAPCSLVEVCRLVALMMEAARTSETSANF
jgi:hypothetical protein